jgi:hypothetical protein
MAVDPFNSVGGYTVGIPPIPIIDSNGNLTVNKATIGDVLISGDQVVTGNIFANTFIGSFEGQISGQIQVPGADTDVVFNKEGQAHASPNLTYDYNNSVLTVDGDLHANSFTLGVGTNEFSTSSVMFAITNSSAPGQVLHFQPSSQICSVDYTIIATDPTSNVRQTSKLFASVLGSEVGYFEYGTIDVPQSSPGVADFKVEYISGNVALTVKPMTGHSTSYKIMVTSYKE